MSKNAISWAVLGILFGFAMLGFGIKQGMSVGEDNVRNKMKYENEMKKLTPTLTPKPTTVIGYKNVFNDDCDVSFLLPENISSGEAKVDLVCTKTTASQEAVLKRDNYELITLTNNKKIWIKSDEHLNSLIRRTLETANE